MVFSVAQGDATKLSNCVTVSTSQGEGHQWIGRYWTMVFIPHLTLWIIERDTSAQYQYDNRTKVTKTDGFILLGSQMMTINTHCRFSGAETEGIILPGMAHSTTSGSKYHPLPNHIRCHHMTHGQIVCVAHLSLTSSERPVTGTYHWLRLDSHYQLGTSWSYR